MVLSGSDTVNMACEDQKGNPKTVVCVKSVCEFLVTGLIQTYVRHGGDQEGIHRWISGRMMNKSFHNSQE